MEVLVASAIVLVFLAVAYPAARALTGRAQGSACAEKLHTLGSALSMYANDHEGYLPPATTAEWAHRDDKAIPDGELAASPDLLRTVMQPYVASDEAWFCPEDPQRGKNVLWLGQRHRRTSFRFDPKPTGEEPGWPPKAQLGHGDAPLISDAYGIPAKDSDRQFRNDKKPASNHPDGKVNAIRQDLSLMRAPAQTFVAAG